MDGTSSASQAVVQDEKGAAAIAATDAPVETFEQDCLEFGPLARGISRFLRNVRTTPPLTLAISGDWGSGKSSLMRLVCADLRKYGTRPVWFNAWHHQTEEQMLASLLSAIQSQGLPHLWSLDNLVFRIRLLGQRAYKAPLRSVASIILFTLAISFFITHNSVQMHDISVALHAWLSNDDKPAPSFFAPLAGQIITFLSAAGLLSTVMKAFGTSSGVVLSNMATLFRMRDNSALAGSRHNFANQFDEVTNSLPYRMVIVIDDLDRCRAETILNLMETVNFLASSGKCIIIFGMATNRVQAALAMSFKEIADDFIPLSVPIPAGATPADISQNARLDYAREYLEKLINIEITVPALQDPILNNLLQNASAPSSLTPPVLRWLSILMAITAAVALGIYASCALDRLINKEFVFAPQQSLGLNHALLFIGPVLALICLTRGLTWYRDLKIRQVEDSKQFQKALECWISVVKIKRGTPRAIKRFGNRIRYLAMLQEAETTDASFLKWILQLRRKAAPSTIRGSGIAEHRLVALGALYEVYGKQWKEEAVNPASNAVLAAIKKYEEECNTTWPPSNKELDAFTKALNGIRLAGDVDILSSSQTVRPSSVNAKA